MEIQCNKLSSCFVCSHKVSCLCVCKRASRPSFVRRNVFNTQAVAVAATAAEAVCSEEQGLVTYFRGVREGRRGGERSAKTFRQLSLKIFNRKTFDQKFLKPIFYLGNMY